MLMRKMVAMKKGLSRFLCLLLSFASAGSLAACGGGSQSDSSGGTVIASANDFDKTLKSIAGTDALGRTFGVADMQKDKYVGLFYFSWLGQEGMRQNIYDLSVLLAEYPEEVFSTSSSLSPVDYHFYGKPLFGYYNSNDMWVVRRHLEMLTFAGVDFLFFDATNGVAYENVWDQMFEVMLEFASQGWNIPKIAFMTNNNSAEVIDILNEKYYTGEKYKPLWFCPVTEDNPEGKPLIIGNRTQVWEGQTKVLSDEILEKFWVRDTQWPDWSQKTTDALSGFPWMEWRRPQLVYDGIMNVSVAQHPTGYFSKNYPDGPLEAIATPEQVAASSEEHDGPKYINWGRGYTSKDKENGDAEKILAGANIQEQWDNVFAHTEVDLVTVTGWNEWIVLKNTPASGGVFDYVYFVDAFNMEYSRDIEPMDGGYGDNYYMQLIQNIRKFKQAEEQTELTGTYKTIDIAESESVFSDVENIYKDFRDDAVNRDADGHAASVHYVDTSARNDIMEIRVANDSEYLYVEVNCAYDIYGDREDNWMTLLVKTEGDGWEHYDYLINRAPDGNQTSIETFIGLEYDQRTLSGSADIYVSGRTIRYRIPLQSLGLQRGKCIEFKVTDNITSPDKITDYYVSGDSAPIGRINYSYKLA